MKPQYLAPMSVRGTDQQQSYGLGLGFEAHMEKQNRVLAQLMGSIAKQEQIEKQRLHMDTNLKIKELELDKLRAELELEKQRKRNQQLLEETPKAKKVVPSLKDVVVSMMVNKKRSSERTEPSLHERTTSMPFIPGNIEEEEDEEVEEIYELRPQPKARSRIVISRGTTRESTLIKLQNQRQKSNEDEQHSASLDYLDENPAPSPQRKSGLEDEE